MGKTAKAKPASQHAIKKPSAVKSPVKRRPRQFLSPEQFRNIFLRVCKTSTSLPYPASGGRRGDLAIGCSAWIRAARTNGEMPISTTTSRAGFLAIHSTRITEQGELVWGVTDQQALSWSKTMAKRLSNLCRHYTQAGLQEPPAQWHAMIKEELKLEHEEEEPAADVPGMAKPVSSITATENEAEEGEEEEPVASDEVDAGADADEVNDEGGDEEMEEEEEEEDEQEAADEESVAWKVDYSYECKKAYRWNGKVREYTDVYKMPTAEADELDSVIGVWPEGFEKEVPGLSCGKIFPEKFKAGGLPRSGKKKGKKTDTEHLWQGTLPGSETMHIAWRSSRGWNITLYKDARQKCQIKPDNFTCHGDADDMPAGKCVKLMIRVAEDWVSGKALETELLKHRDSLIAEFGLIAMKGKPAANRKMTAPIAAAAKATAPASSPITVTETPGPNKDTPPPVTVSPRTSPARGITMKAFGIPAPCRMQSSDSD